MHLRHLSLYFGLLFGHQLLPYVVGWSFAERRRTNAIPLFCSARRPLVPSPVRLYSASSNENLSNDKDDSEAVFNMTSVDSGIHKKIRLAKAQAEIDRILASPDAPADLEEELKKVEMIAPETTQSTEELQMDAHESQLEQELYQAAKQLDFEKAAKIKKEISQLHIDDCGSVLQVNSQFYKAFSNQDFAHMTTLWTRDGMATCIHPSSNPIVGTKNVLASWQRMFTAQSNQKTVLEPHKIRLAVKGSSTAIVTCEEHVYSRRFIRGQKRKTELTNKLLATNLFRKVNGRWLLHYHHASWHADSTASKLALKGMSSAGTGGASSNAPIERLDNNGKTIDDNPMHGILGTQNNGPWLGSGEKKSAGKEIVIESLSEMLKRTQGRIFRIPGNQGSGGENKNKDDSAPIIHISSHLEDMDDEDLLDEDDDEDDEDDELYDEEEDDEEEEEEEDQDFDAKNAAPGERGILKRWVLHPHGLSKKKLNKRNNVTGAPKDGLRQECIGALRKLCDQGAISPKQKRVLLTDIIGCSKKGDFSMVEVAFELLCGECEDKDVAQEEFADQCRVLAQSLPDPLSPSLQ